MHILCVELFISKCNHIMIFHYLIIYISTLYVPVCLEKKTRFHWCIRKAGELQYIFCVWCFLICIHPLNHCFLIIDSKILIILHIFILFFLECIELPHMAKPITNIYKYTAEHFVPGDLYGAGTLLCGIHFLTFAFWRNIEIIFICKPLYTCSAHLSHTCPPFVFSAVKISRHPRLHLPPQ